MIEHVAARIEDAWEYGVLAIYALLETDAVCASLIGKLTESLLLRQSSSETLRI